jgi:AcrR family transcriptional regulator
VLSDPAIVERHGGRHHDASRDEALRAADLKLLAEIGYDRLTIDAIAARAGAGKATIYRRWSGKAELVVDALTCEKVLRPTPNTGSLRGDLTALAQRTSRSESKMDTQVMIGLVSALPHDAELREVFRERLVGSHVATLTEIFDRAVLRGEILPVKNFEIVISIIPALVLHSLLTRGEIPDKRYIEMVVDDVILPLVLGGPNAAAPCQPPN